VNKPLPLPFLKRIQEEIPDLYSYFSNHSNRPPYKALRVNPKKSISPSFLASFVPVPWCPLGYYVDEKIGSHPYHQAGQFYIQEPSAMAVVELMNIQKDDYVLDCSAAPGGKSTHIAGYLGDQGFLWSHDVDRSRAQQLVFNLERMGFYNGIVSTGPLDSLRYQKEQFTKIVVDAPCSGEGMFIKDDGAIQQWSNALVQQCAFLQENILEHIVELLKPGGELTYSTCTFSRQENELQILRFLEKHQEMELVNDPYLNAFNQKVTNGVGAKILPTEHRGEGHYLVKLKKKGPLIRSTLSVHRNHSSSEWQSFEKKHGIEWKRKMKFKRVGSYLYAIVHEPNTQGIAILREGLCMGEIKSFGFVPHHALSHANEVTLPRMDLELSSPLLATYLRGESFSIDQPDGWYVISIHNQGLGWVKVARGVAKNHYPKGLRLHYDIEG
jgi:16S rRNA C967 or C1407 C5-methylase (RsmB/RsmF family)/NOL1/NOP2/fmu family ribosome biogenesis protein